MMKSEVKERPKFNKIQRLTRAQAISVANRLRKGQSLKEIAKSMDRDPAALGYHMQKHGFSSLKLKKA